MNKKFKIWTRELEQEPIKIERESREEFLQRWKPIKIEYDMPEVQISFIDKLNYWIRLGSKYSTLIIGFIKIIIGITMNNDKKTTILGYIKAGLFIIAGGLLLAGLVPESLLTSLGGADTSIS